MDLSILVFGFLPLGILLMLAAGVLYVLSAIWLWNSSRGESIDLVNALIAFLLYQAVAKFSMGLGAYTSNPLFGKIAALAIIIGAVYMLKFPLSVLSQWSRKVLFRVIFIISILGFAWFMGTPERQDLLVFFATWYDIILNGVIVGGTIIVFGIKSANRVYKTKAVGGGSGVVSCCVAANVSMLSGAALASLVFGFLSPILILGSMLFVRNQSQSNS